MSRSGRYTSGGVFPFSVCYFGNLGRARFALALPSVFRVPTVLAEIGKMLGTAALVATLLTWGCGHGC